MLASLVALLLAVAVGVTVHELAHVAALRAFGVPYRLRWTTGPRPSGGLRNSLLGIGPTVTHRAEETAMAGWKLRVAALMPLGLALPFVAIPLGLIPDPIATGSWPVKLAVVGWLACAIPSPADFSIFWHPERSVDAITS